MSEDKTEPEIQQTPPPPVLNDNTETLPEVVKDSDNTLPTTEQSEPTKYSKTIDENGDEIDNEFSGEDFMLNPPEILKKEHIHELQGREAAARLIKAMMMKPEEEEEEIPREPYYWEEFPDEVPTKRVLYDNMRYYGSNLLYYMERAGNVLTHLFGLDQREFQDVIDEHERVVEARRIRKLKEQKRREREAKNLDKMEQGSEEKKNDLINDESSSDSDSSSDDDDLE